MNYNRLSLARYGEVRDNLLYAAVFLISIKLSLAYVFLLPFLVLKFLDWKKNKHLQIIGQSVLWLPLFLFVLSMALSAFFGVDTFNSLKGMGTLLILIFLPLAVSEQLEDRSPLPLLQVFLAGQVIAAFESILNAMFSDRYTQIFLGAITESGQLAMSTVLCVGLSLQWIKREKDFSLETKKALVAKGTALFLLTIFTCFSSFAPLIWINYLAFSALIGIALYKIASSISRGERTIAWGVALLTLMSPILFATLCINLKRGPWAGVIAALSVLLFLYSRKLLLLFLLGVFSVFALSAPLNERLMQSAQHFEMSGGRATIWQIAEELAGKYPLGVGWENARIFQRFSAQVPAELTHFHNNIINIAIEGGVVTLSLFIWWLVSVLEFCFRSKVKSNEILLRSLGAALLSWQVAGLVEYNFGDTEVLLVALLITGIIHSYSQVEAQKSYSARFTTAMSSSIFLLISRMSRLKNDN